MMSDRCVSGETVCDVSIYRDLYVTFEQVCVCVCVTLFGLNEKPPPPLSPVTDT